MYYFIYFFLLPICLICLSDSLYKINQDTFMTPLSLVSVEYQHYQINIPYKVDVLNRPLRYLKHM